MLDQRSPPKDSTASHFHHVEAFISSKLFSRLDCLLFLIECDDKQSKFLSFILQFVVSARPFSEFEPKIEAFIGQQVTFPPRNMKKSVSCCTHKATSQCYVTRHWTAIRNKAKSWLSFSRTPGKTRVSFYEIAKLFFYFFLFKS
jgi:hypothetical protein